MQRCRRQDCNLVSREIAGKPGSRSLAKYGFAIQFGMNGDLETGIAWYIHLKADLTNDKRL